MTQIGRKEDNCLGRHEFLQETMAAECLDQMDFRTLRKAVSVAPQPASPPTKVPTSNHTSVEGTYGLKGSSCLQMFKCLKKYIRLKLVMLFEQLFILISTYLLTVGY